MARPGSVEVGGYYPTPVDVLPGIASIIAWPEGSAHGLLLDPCAGEGEAIAAIRRAWAGRPSAYASSAPSVVACELETSRALRLRKALAEPRDRALHGDAFRLLPTHEPSAGGGGATVLYLNPPYDHDAEHGRLEHRFLLRFTEHLALGSGILLFVVPARALSASAEHLATRYAELRCWRFPDPEYSRFGQVVVAGRRRSQALDSAPGAAAAVRRWASAAGELPVLPERVADPFEVPPAGTVWYHLDYRLAEADLGAAVAAFEPWSGGETGGRLAAGELLGSRFPVALPPKPAHIALALAGGMFNGHRLEPDDPRLPPLLAKGSYRRESVEIDSRETPDGTVQVTTIDRPRLTVTVLRLDTGEFETLAEGVDPEGGDEISRWTAADLLLRYGRSMAALLKRQFPPLHDPADPRHRLALPELVRRPYQVQDHAIQGGLKLLASGQNPMLTAEVGTGKTTMALYVAWALSPAHHAETLRQLRELGFEGVPPVVRRTLVLCPPHLLGSWCDQAAAVVPEARVQIVQDAADLEADADVYVLSRERAKLGHGHRGVAALCPRCATAVEVRADAAASRRLRCEARSRRPADHFAALAVELGALLAHALPEDDLVASVAPRRLLRHFADRGPIPLSLDRLRLFRDGLFGHLRLALGETRPTERMRLLYGLLDLLAAITEALGEPLSAVVERLEHLAAELPESTPAELLRRAARSLSQHRGAGDEAASVPPERRLLQALEALEAQASWQESPPCGEPLYQAEPPRRIPLARWILRRYRRRFDLVILDEAHEYNHAGSAQAKAAHRLTGLPGVPTVVLTGSLMGGYASSLFAIFHALSPAFREEFGRDEAAEFVARYGFQKVRLTLKGSSDSRRGRRTDRELASRRVVGEAPGIHPLFLMRYLLPTAIPVHKSDLEKELPPLTEEPVVLPVPERGTRAEELLAEYRRLQGKLLERIREDRDDPALAGRLLGALVELPSYLDRSTEDLGHFVLRYPESVGGEEIATGRSFPADWRTPKEEWLLGELGRRVEAGERTLLFLRHTGSRLPRRLLRLVDSIAPGAVRLDTPKVPTARREAWIDRHVNEPGAPVLIVNPNAVRTGLNNLVGFSTAIWYELDPSAFTYRQAIGRLHRIGQERPVTILIPYYPATAQEILFRLVAKKVSASLQVDGLDVRAALEAAGAGDGMPDGLDAALSLGRAVYRALTRAA
jgi:hypothetical protein